MSSRAPAWLAALGLAAACAKPAPPAPAAAPTPSPAPSAALSAPSGRDVVLFVGDSLTAGYGVAAEDAYPALLDARWRAEGLPWRARDTAVSGATSADALSSLDWGLAPDVGVVVVAIGANDGLRGLDPAQLERNLDEILARVKRSGAKALLAGMRMPPNYGAGYAARFAAVYPRVARKAGVPLLPFLLEGVAGKAALNQPDGLHPTAAGHRVVADAVDAALRKAGLL